MLLPTNGVLPECILPCCHDNRIYLKLPWQHDIDKICKECNYKIYKDLLYKYMDAYVLLIGIMECCGQGYIVIPRQLSKTD